LAKVTRHSHLCCRSKSQNGLNVDISRPA